jgi:hypothetical protein
VGGNAVPVRQIKGRVDWEGLYRKFSFTRFFAAVTH